MVKPSVLASDAAPPDLTRSFTVADRLAVASAALFVAMLALAAYWDSSIRVLHAFEAVPYLLAAALIAGRRRYGYILGVASGTFWLWMAACLTTFVKNGFQRLASLIQTGHVDRWDVFIAVPAALGTGGLVLFSALSYMRSADKSRMDVVRFLLTLGVVGAFFVIVFRLFAPQYLRIFGSLLPHALRP